MSTAPPQASERVSHDEVMNTGLYPVGTRMRPDFVQGEDANVRHAVGWEQANENLKKRDEQGAIYGSDYTWTEYAVEKVPFVGAIKKTGFAMAAYDSAKKIHNGTADQRDYDELLVYGKRRETEEGRGWLGGAGDLIASLPGFAAEFMLTGGAYTVGKKAATKGVEKVASGMVKKHIGKAVAATVPRAAGLAAFTAANPQLVAERISHRHAPVVIPNETDAGYDAPFVVESDEGAIESLTKGTIDAYTELASEKAGALITRIPALKKFKGVIARAFFGEASGKGSVTAKKLAAILNRAGYQGPIEEMGEERLKEIADGLTGVQDDFGTVGKLASNPLDTDAWSQLSQEAAAFSIPGAPGAAIRLNEGRRRAARLEELKAIRSGGYVSGATEWATQNPNDAVTLLDQDQPDSRTSFRDAGLLDTYPKGKDRTAFVEELKNLTKGPKESPQAPQEESQPSLQPEQAPQTASDAVTAPEVTSDTPNTQEAVRTHPVAPESELGDKPRIFTARAGKSSRPGIEGEFSAEGKKANRKGFTNKTKAEATEKRTDGLANSGRTDLLPEGWSMEIGQTRTKEGHTFEAEVDWRNKNVVFSEERHMKDPEKVNHEIAHVVIENAIAFKDSHPLLEGYVEAKSEEWKKKGHDPEWIVKNQFHREEIAMDYGNYLSGKAIPDAVRSVFEKHLPQSVESTRPGIEGEFSVEGKKAKRKGFTKKTKQQSNQVTPSDYSDLRDMVDSGDILSVGEDTQAGGVEIAEGATLSEAIESVSLSGVYRSLWDALRPILEGQQLGMPTLHVLGEVHGGKGHGRYDPGTHSIEVLKGLSTPRLQRVLLHEAVHAATRQAIAISQSLLYSGDRSSGVSSQAKGAYERLDKILYWLRSEIDKAGLAPRKFFAGKVDVLELITEVFTNPELQEFMASRKVPGSTKFAHFRNKNLLQAFWDAIGKLLNIVKGKRAATALEEVVGLSATFMQEDMVGDVGGKSLSASLKKKLESEPTIKLYRAMQLIDGKLYPPMSAKIGKDLRPPTTIGAWEQAEERPELADDKGKFKLSKGNAKTITARYNPYFHASKSPLNDQFTSASKRPNLVTVEVEVPESELTSGYKAEKAKDSVGEKNWNKGPVSKHLKGDKQRKVVLSRYSKVVRVVPDAEVAEIIATILKGENLSVPSNVVTPSLREALIANGVNVTEALGASQSSSDILSAKPRTVSDIVAKIIATEQFSSAEDLTEHLVENIGKERTRKISEIIQTQWEQSTSKPVESDGIKEDAGDIGQEPGNRQGITAVPISPQKNKDAFHGVRRWFKKFFTAPGEAPVSVYDHNVTKNGQVSKAMNQIKYLAADYRRGLKKALKGKRATAKDRAKINDVLAGNANLDTLPVELRAPIRAMRGHIDAMSRMFIASGLAQGDLIGIIEENEGMYVTRSYRVFTDPKWKDKVSDKVRNIALAAIRKDFPDATNEEVHGILDHLLSKGFESGTPNNLFKSGKLGGKDLGVFKKKKNVPKWLRDLWGEHKDAEANFAITASKMATLLANHQFLESVKDSGLGVFLRDASEGPAVTEFGSLSVQLSAEGNPSMAPLDGMWTTQEIKDHFDQLERALQADTWLRVFYAANGLVKMGKTVGSVGSHVRNFVANPGFALANGHWRLDKVKQATMATAVDMTNWSNQDWRDYHSRTTELCLTSEDVRANEVKAILSDVFGESDEAMMYSPEARQAHALVKIGKAIARVVGEAYQKGDSFWKIFAWENEKARYRKARPEWSEAKLERFCADIVRNTWPTWDKVPRGIQNLRRFPLVGTFVGFNYETVRTLYHTLAIARQEIRDPATRSIGIQRFIGTSAALTASSAMSIASMMIAGIAFSDDEDIRENLPPYMENSALIYLPKDKNGHHQVIDMGHVDPRSVVTKTIIAALRGDTAQEKIIDSAGEFTDPFLSEEILFKSLTELWRNKKGFGGPIYNEEDTAAGKASDVGTHLVKTFEPGTVTSGRRIWKGATGHVDPSGKTYNAKAEAAAVATGQRIYTVDPAQSLVYKTRSFKYSLTKVQNLLRSVLTRKGTVSPSEVTAAQKKMEQLRLAKFTKMTKTVNAARGLGMADIDIILLLKAEGLSTANRNMVLDGTYYPYAITRQTRTQMFKAAPKAAQSRLDALEKPKPNATR